MEGFKQKEVKGIQGVKKEQVEKEQVKDLIKEYKALNRKKEEIEGKLETVHIDAGAWELEPWIREEIVKQFHEGFKIMDIRYDPETYNPIYILGRPKGKEYRTKDLVYNIIDQGKIEDFIKNIDKFEGLDKELALKIIEDSPSNKEIKTSPEKSGHAMADTDDYCFYEGASAWDVLCPDFPGNCKKCDTYKDQKEKEDNKE